MVYRIAFGTLDGKNTNVNFGTACRFEIYEVWNQEYHFLEKREYVQENEDKAYDKTGCCGEYGCSDGQADSCKTGKRGGCGGNGGKNSKVEFLSDCRAVVCKKIGFNITRQLEKKAIAVFDVECPIEVALDKVSKYFFKVDAHQSLRGSAREN
jgi:hypothetical protein